MILAILALIAIFIIWKLFIDGWLFKLILFIFGWWGLFFYLENYIEGADQTALIFSGYSCSWSALIPTIICVLALLCTSIRD